MKGKHELQYEVDLYEPIERYFVEQGYNVHGEVNDCDVVAIQEEILMIVELKLKLNIDLLIQATKRQRLTEFVYIAVPRPSYSMHSRKWRDLCHLVRRLEMGLLVVTDQQQVKVIHEPSPFDRAKSMGQSKQRRDRLFSEIEGRRVSKNIGGSHQTKIHTAYKESCIHIACCLEHFGPLSPRSLRKIGTGDKTYSILYDNYYRWFEKVERGIYTLTDRGLKEYTNDQEIAAFYTEQMKADLGPGQEPEKLGP